MSMDLNRKMDLTEYIKSVNLLMAQMGGEGVELSAEDQAMLDALKTDGFDLALRGDMAEGTLYMNMKGDIIAAAGMNGEDWYKLDMATLMDQMGMDWAELMAASKNLDYTALAKSAIGSLSLNDSTTAYTQVKETVEKIVNAVSDEGFVKEGNEYTAIVAMEEDDAVVMMVLVMTMEKDAVTGYVMGVSMEATEDEMTVSMDMTVSVDDKDQMTAEMHMDAAGLMTMEMTMDGSYTQGKTAPATEPPAGANVVDLMELMSEEMNAEEKAALGIIGGADGPTSTYVAGS